MKNRKKIILVAGARPNFMKVAPIYAELTKHKRFLPILVHTGQHYDREMSDFFFRDLKLPRPDIYLGVGSASHAVQTARIMKTFEPVVLQEKPDLVMVVGDVNSTIACAMTAVKLGIKVAHVEAGLRSFDRSMPEEINRLLTDQISDYLFTTCPDANKNLLREGIAKEKIFMVGNVMIDSLRKVIVEIKKKKIEDINRPYVLVTLHRPSNVDDKFIFKNIIKALSVIVKQTPVIFPVHPRTLKRIKQYGMINIFEYRDKKINYGEIKQKILLIPPQGYLEFMGLMTRAALVLTDSGGIQEETTILGVPCLTIRNNTERPITITQGTNKLVGTDPMRIINESLLILNKKEPINLKKSKRPAFWDGFAARRIVKIINKKL